MLAVTRSPRMGSPLVPPATDLVEEEKQLINESGRRRSAQQQVQKALLEQQRALQQREAGERRWLNAKRREAP